MRAETPGYSLLHDLPGTVFLLRLPVPLIKERGEFLHLRPDIFDRIPKERDQLD